MEEHSLKPEGIDLVITGRNGDTRNDRIYKELTVTIFKSNAIANYKHLCGEYPVSTSFALWMAANILKKGTIPEAIVERKLSSGAPKTILVYNHYQNKYHSLMLLSSV